MTLEKAPKLNVAERLGDDSVYLLPGVCLVASSSHPLAAFRLAAHGVP